MKEAFEIARIIQKSLKGKLSESEERQLSGWRKVSDENERAFQRMISEDFYTIGMEKLEMYDSRVAYGRFLQKKYQQRRKRRFLINMARVAAVALPFVIALVLYVGLNREEEQMVRPSLASNILPGTSKAVLTLANGQMIPLGKEATDSTIITDGTQISASGSGVTYASGVESESVVYNKLEIPRGGEFCLTLSDGTRVWLNSETSIQYPVAFGAKERRVFVQGEAYFEVAKDEGKPFHVLAKGADIKVLGTSFNVMTYRGRTITTLVEGKVCLTYKDESVLMVPDRQAEVIAETGKILMREVDARNFTLWKDGVFYFENAALETIAERLSQWYDVNIVFNDEALKKLRYSVEMKRYNNIQDLLTKIEKTQKVKFLIQGKSIYIHKWLETYDLLE